MNEKALEKILNIFLEKVLPLTEKGVARGSKIFGAAIIKKDDLSVVIAETNNEIENPLWHGEMHAIKKFYDDLNYEGLDSKVLSMTFSEFGRRVKENGSQGTDHGSAAPTLLFGPPLRGSGIIGEWPSLDNLNRRGNMYNSIDFRSIYQTILKDWLCGDSEYIDKAMLGNEYDALGLGFSCNDSDIIYYNDLFNYHHPIYTNSNNKINLNLRIKQSHNVTIRVYDILGRHISTVFDGQLMGGEHTFPLSHNRGGKISSGQYFYRIGISGGQTLSKSFVVR